MRPSTVTNWLLLALAIAIGAAIVSLAGMRPAMATTVAGEPMPEPQPVAPCPLSMEAFLIEIEERGGVIYGAVAYPGANADMSIVYGLGGIVNYVAFSGGCFQAGPLGLDYVVGE